MATFSYVLISYCAGYQTQVLQIIVHATQDTVMKEQPGTLHAVKI